MIECCIAFLTQGNAALDEMHAINARLSAIKIVASEDFPLNQSEVHDFRAQLAKQILHIRDIEQIGIDMLQAATIPQYHCHRHRPPPQA